MISLALFMTSILLLIPGAFGAAFFSEFGPKKAYRAAVGIAIVGFAFLLLAIWSPLLGWNN